MMHERGKSDSAVRAVKPANKAERSAAELVEQRAGTQGNADQQSTRRAQERESVSQALGRIRQAAKQRKLEDGVVTVSERGTGQGSVISPLLANAYLHYSFDLWAERWRRREATGDMIIVR